MYENYFPYEDKTLVGTPIVSTTSELNLYVNYPGYGKGYKFNGDNLRAGYATGRIGEYDGNTIIQIMLEFSEDTFGYVVAEDGFKKGNKPNFESDDSAQKLINNLLVNNRIILENNLLSAGIIEKLNAKGKQVSSQYLNKLAQLQRNLEYRNNRLSRCPFFKSKGDISLYGYNRYSQTLKSISDNPQIGIAPVVIYILGTILITALAGWIIYLLFKPDYTDSKADLVQSQLLIKALSYLSPDERAEVINDLEGQIDKSFLTGKMKGQKAGSFDTLKNIGTLAAGIGIFFLAKPVGERLGIIDKK